MSANTENTLTGRLKAELKKRKMSVPEFQEETGIPKDRVYKWLKRDTDKIGHEDANIIEKWINGQLDNVPHGTLKNTGNQVTDQSLNNLTESNRVLAEANKTLAEANKTLAEANHVISKNHDELIQLTKMIVSSSSKQTVSEVHPGSSKTGDIPASQGDLALDKKYSKDKNVLKGS